VPVRFRFKDKNLELLYTQGVGASRFPKEVVNAFLRRVRHIEAAKDERDLRVPPSVHYERLKGRYKGKEAMRLNREWRMIISVDGDSQGKYVLIQEINRHYGD
jgi:toxin HigB-1